MKVEIFVTGIISTNCYVVSNEETKEAVIIDPAACPKKLTNYIMEEGLQVKAVLLTHGHFDHMMGAQEVMDRYQVPVYVHEAERELIENPQMNLSASYTNGVTFTNGTYVKDEEVLSFAGYDFLVLHTPGHTQGGVCYYVKSEDVVFSGDTLFCNSVGRTDFPTSSMSDLIRSIRDKLLPMPDETIVYPGHMGATTIGNERVTNPFI